MFLLATGERGLGWDAVRRLSFQEFELLWAIQQRVLERAAADTSDATNPAISARRAIQMEKMGVTMPEVLTRPFDPETATPDEIAAWMKAAGAHMPN
jgi:hypothetical protein